MTYLEKLKSLNTHRTENEYAERICSELIYLDGVSSLHGDRYTALLERAIDFLLDSIQADGSITRTSALCAEEMLCELAPVAKSYRALFVAHAHIDMNWMWGYNETVAVTLDTFRTVLTLMREYPEFTFAQSQASVYEIVEKYEPEMLDEIRARIHEGRWEVTAAEWVEPDKNMPNGESLTRQILQARKYLSSLLSIPADSLCVDFVPDTFGHNAQIPEILTNAGVRYMYHCRGMEMGEINVYRYRAPSGKETLNYREYMWYNGTIAPEKFEIVPRFCKANGVNTYLCVYGVGDHGGGPSRRDVERILKYRSWPLTPEISFGTFRQFFEAMEQSGTEFPVIDREMNCLFTGCYTTQARIKMANRIAEARINEAEALTAMDSILTDSERRQDQLDGAWRNVLFGHFHDILPGSGTVETREYAMGKFQETLASVSTCAGRAMRSIASRIDTSRIAFDSPEDSISEGGGVGYAQSELRGFGMPSAERGRGTVRAVHVFNPTAYQRNEFTEIVLWDYPCEDRLTAEDSEGNTLEFHVTCASGKGYWGHQFTRVLVKVNVAPFGYATVIFRPRREEGHFEHHFRAYELSDEHINDAPLVLENECIRATFDHTSLELVSLIDKASGESLIDTPSCSLELIEENPIYRMGAWRVGPYMKREVLNRTRTVRFTGEQKNEIFSSISYEIRFDSSLARVEIQLKKDSPVLEFSLNLDWNERPQNDELIPQLRFAVPVSYSTTGSCVCDIPYGEITRSQQAHDVPALSYLGICGSTKHIVGITTDTKYGYRCYEDVGSVTLVRSTNKPDLSFSDRGIHNVRIGVMAVAPANLKEYADCFNHPLAHLSATAHEGTLPLNGSALQVSGTVVMSCLKCAEANDGDVIRLYNVTDQPQKTTVTSAGEIASAAYTDTNEAPLSSVAPVGNTVTVTVGAFSVVTLKIIPKK